MQGTIFRWPYLAHLLYNNISPRISLHLLLSVFRRRGSLIDVNKASSTLGTQVTIRPYLWYLPQDVFIYPNSQGIFYSTPFPQYPPWILTHQTQSALIIANLTAHLLLPQTITIIPSLAAKDYLQPVIFLLSEQAFMHYIARTHLTEQRIMLVVLWLQSPRVLLPMLPGMHVKFLVPGECLFLVSLSEFKGRSRL